MFKKLFRKNNHILNNAEITNSRYTVDILNPAYDNMLLKQYGDKTIGEMTLPLPAIFDNIVEVYFHTSKENADLIMKNLFIILYKIDTFVQGDGFDDYEISQFDVYDNKVVIGYWGTKVNTSFDANVFIEAGKWYCTEIGMMKFNPPRNIDHMQ